MTKYIMLYRATKDEAQSLIREIEKRGPSLMSGTILDLALQNLKGIGKPDPDRPYGITDKRYQMERDGLVTVLSWNAERSGGYVFLTQEIEADGTQSGGESAGAGKDGVRRRGAVARAGDEG